MKTVVALYEDFNTARDVVEDLVEAGFSRDRISLVANDASGEYKRYIGTDDDDVSAGEGAGFGAVVGGLIGLGAMLIPGIGPVIAAGPLVAGLTGAAVGAAAGAATGGIVGSLVDMGVNEDEAGYYAEGVRRGGALVTVQIDDNWENRVVDIMSRHRPVDIRRSAEEWRRSGWTGFDASDTSYSAHTTGTQSAQGTRTMSQGGHDNEARLQVIEEDLQVGKREVERGAVRARTVVEETPVQEEVTLREEHVKVERHPVDRPVDPNAVEMREQTVEITERAEEPVVAKQARVVEEVVIRKDVDEHTETVQDTVRRQDVEIDNMGARTGQRTFESYDTDWRTHYNTTYGSRGRDYSVYMPAYQYGYMLASDPRYNQYRTWSEVESYARRDWETRNQGPWEDFKDAIQHAWNRIRNAVS
ncbi:MAG: YsnF/AvaK domain-containing protein [Chloroflexi bacterium]|nr:YsnF/AvaK domain-containing protein [Chloroflexota bacterium]